MVAGVIVAGAVLFATLYKAAPTGGTGAVNPGGQQGANTANLMKPQTTDIVLGDANAPVTMIEYGDYQCPYCTAFFSQTQSLIVSNYVNAGKVKFIFRDLIVNDRQASDHESHDAALAVACGAEQGKFWQFHDAVYQAEAKDETKNGNTSENNGNLSRTLFVSIAQTLGMDQAKFTSCFDSKKYASQVQAQSDDAAANGVSATPSFYVNGQEVVGAQPYGKFQAVLNALVKN